MGVEDFFFKLHNKLLHEHIFTSEKVFAAALILAITSIGLLSSMTPVKEYRRYSFDSFGSEKERVTEECTCYGPLITMESSPPQYNCQGYEMYKSVNYTRPRK